MIHSLSAPNASNRTQLSSTSWRLTKGVIVAGQAEKVTVSLNAALPANGVNVAYNGGDKSASVQLGSTKWSTFASNVQGPLTVTLEDNPDSFNSQSN
jgi:protein-disulfide isomerase